MSKIEVMNTEFGTIKNAAGFNNFVLSIKQRILQTNAVGIIAKSKCVCLFRSCKPTHLSTVVCKIWFDVFDNLTSHNSHLKFNQELTPTNRFYFLH